MNVLGAALGAAVVVLAMSGTALAHGGAYAEGGGGAPGAGSVPPGTTDRPGAITRWEKWWAHNKEPYLRVRERMLDDGRAVTPVAAADGDSPISPAAEREMAFTVLRGELVPVFIEALGDKSSEVRTAAAIALGKTGDTRGSAPLREAAASDDRDDVRESGLLGLGLLGRAENMPFLATVLDKRDLPKRQRAFAAFSLGLIGGEEACDLLLHFAGRVGLPRDAGRRFDREVSACAFLALGLTGRKEVVPTLQDALLERKLDEEVRAFVLLALARLRDADTLPVALKMLAKETNDDLRRSAAVAVGRIAKPGNEEVIAALVKALRGDKDPVVRHFSAVSLGRLANDEARATLVDMLGKGDVYDRPYIGLALGLAGDIENAPPIRKQLKKEKVPGVRGAYCIALALLGDMEAVPLLERDVAARGDIWVAGYAALGLGMLGSRSSADVLFERLERDHDPRVRQNLAVGLGMLHDERAKDYLVRTLRGSGSLFERGGAAMALGVLRRRDAAPILRGLYADRNEGELIRAFALVALGVLVDPAPVPRLTQLAIDNNYGLSVDPLNEVLTIL